MAAIVHDAYLESRVLTADPLELIRMLYRAALGATGRARAHLAGGRIAERSREISRAWAILGELAAALDHQRGGELSGRLAGLYAYLQERLLEANLRQKAEPLAEVEKLLKTLLEGWEGARPAVETPAGHPHQEEEEISKGSGEAGYPSYAGGWPLAADAREHRGQCWSF
jgi:flagellar secretion chaperone FliS